MRPAALSNTYPAIGPDNEGKFDCEPNTIDAVRANERDPMNFIACTFRSRKSERARLRDALAVSERYRDSSLHAALNVQHEAELSQTAIDGVVGEPRGEQRFDVKGQNVVRYPTISVTPALQRNVWRRVKGQAEFGDFTRR